MMAKKTYSVDHKQCQKKWYDMKNDLGIKKVWLKTPKQKKPRLTLEILTEVITTVSITEHPTYFDDDAD